MISYLQGLSGKQYEGARNSGLNRLYVYNSRNIGSAFFLRPQTGSGGFSAHRTTHENPVPESSLKRQCETPECRPPTLNVFRRGNRKKSAGAEERRWCLSRRGKQPRGSKYRTSQRCASVHPLASGWRPRLGRHHRCSSADSVPRTFLYSRALKHFGSVDGTRDALKAYHAWETRCVDAAAMY